MVRQSSSLLEQHIGWKESLKEIILCGRCQVSKASLNIKTTHLITYITMVELKKSPRKQPKTGIFYIHGKETWR